MKSLLYSRLKGLLLETKGSLVINFALIVPVLLALGAAGIDFAAYNQQKAGMQAAADAAALAAAREASLEGWTSTVANSIAEAVVDSNYGAVNVDKSYHKVSTLTDDVNRKITVTVEQDHYPYFSASLFPSPQIVVSATATASGSSNICVIGLDENRSRVLQLDDSALLTTSNCSVYSNSEAIDGIYAVHNSMVTSNLTCSAGGVKSGSGNFSKEPVTNCPKIADPLASRPAPSFGTHCDHDGLYIQSKGKPVTLMPGVYCNGLTIKNTIVTFNPGEYIIKDGPLRLAANANVYGKGVGFYFTGDGASFSLESGSVIELMAPENGPLAGLMFFQDRNSKETDFTLFSNNASVMVGTVYLPNGNLIIDTISPVADKSAYTAIVTRSLTLWRQPNVVLNTDYGATDVPVPAGIGGSSGGKASVRLID